MNERIIKPPTPHKKYPFDTVVFLAGSIEMDTAVNWQKKAEQHILQYKNHIVLNPRRDDWDSSWTQSIDNFNFNEQVTWELDGLEKFANIILFHFEPDTKSPITLMELGLMAPRHQKDKELFVSCPEGFWRKGNVDILCKRYDIKVYNSLDELLQNVF